MSLGSIAVYKGKFAYDAVNCFAELMAEGFRACGYDARLIDLRQGSSFVDELKPLIAKGDCKMIFSLAGAGAELKLSNGMFLHDAFSAPFVAAMVDHPAHFLGRFEPKNVHVGCSDQSHCDYMDLRFQGAKRSFVFHHGGCPPPEAPALPFAERPFSIVLPASYMDLAQAEQALADMPALPRRIGSLALELVEASDSLATHAALMEAARSLGASLSRPEHFAMVMDGLFGLFERLVRARRRRRVLRRLDAAGVKVDIFGEGWPAGVFKRHVLHPPLAFQDVLKLFSRSKIALNLRSVPGSHERVPSAAMAGALVVSDYCDCVASQFKENEEIVLFRWTRSEELPSLLTSLLGDVPRMASIAEAGRKRAFADHSWTNRAKLVLSEFKLPIGS